MSDAPPPDQPADQPPASGEAPAGETPAETPPAETPAASGGAETPPADSGAETATASEGEKGEGEAEAKKSKSKKSSSKTKRKKGPADPETAKIGFLGAGKMTESIITGLMQFGKVDASRIFVAAPSTKNTDKLKSMGVTCSKRNIDIFGRFDCDIVFLCFHGCVIKQCYKMGGTIPFPLCTNYIPNMKHAVYILSLVSGIGLPQIKACLLNPENPEKYKIEMHRIMLNAACAYGLGICAIDVEPDGKKLSAPLRTILSNISRLEHVPESQMDAACALGGSGLAFAHYFLSAMADGAFKMGLSRQMAIKLAAKTAQAGSQCCLESGKHPSELIDAVSAPSGSAIYGMHSLDKADVKSGIVAAVEAAHKRAQELCEAEASSSN